MKYSIRNICLGIKRRFVNKVPNYMLITREKAEKLRDAWKDKDIPSQQNIIIGNFTDDSWKDEPMNSAIRLLEKTGNSKNILEIGCSTGYYVDIFRNAGFNMDYTGIDISPFFVGEAIKRHPNDKFLIADSESLPFMQSSFDVAFSAGVLLHSVDYIKAIKEAIRVSRKYVIFHRTPVLHFKETNYFEKSAYNVKMFEIFFNEEELVNIFNRLGTVVKSVTTHHKMTVDNIEEPVFMKSYLCEKI